MDFLTAAVLSGVAYDYIKKGAALTGAKIKSELKEWLIGDDIAINVSEELKKLQLTDDLSERAIERKISQSPELMKIIAKIQQANEINTVTQTHLGQGDNIGRDKIVNKSNIK